MIEATDKQKLDFLENLLKTNEQIKLQFYNFIAFNKQLEQSIKEDDMESLVSEIFDDFELIDTSDYMENHYCHCNNGYYYDDEFENAADEILQEAYKSYEIIINAYVDNLQIYEAVRYMSAIYKALLLKPEITDDNYDIFDEAFDSHATYYLKDIVDKIATKLQDVMLPNNAKEKTIEYLVTCVDDTFELDIFTTLLQSLICDEDMSNLVLKWIDYFPVLVKLHICEILKDDEKYINYAKNSYKNNSVVSELLLTKLSRLDRYREYEQIAQNLFEENPKYYSPVILKFLQYEKSKELYSNALKQRCVNQSSLKDYKELKQYLNNSELAAFRLRVKQSYQQKFYVAILEYEKIYDEILKIANENRDSYELHYFIKPIKNIFPKEVFEIVVASCNNVLKATKRNRSTYKTMTTLLKVIIDVVEIKDALKNYIQTNLYNHQPRLPALRDELEKEKLIQR